MWSRGIPRPLGRRRRRSKIPPALGRGLISRRFTEPSREPGVCGASKLVIRLADSRADQTDPRRYLFRSFIAIAEKLEPRIVLMENVPGLLSADKEQLMKDILKLFEGAGFRVEHQVLRAEEFGVPQARRRVFLIAVNCARSRQSNAVLDRFWAELDTRRTEERVTVRQALSGVFRIGPGEGFIAFRRGVRGTKSEFARRLSAGSDFLLNHEAREHNPRDIDIFRRLREGETADELEVGQPGIIPYRMDSFKDKYRKLDSREPAPTIPAHLDRDANAFVHPDLPRGITCREAARLQSFPDDFFFLGGFGPAFHQVGDAVPPVLARAIGEAAREILGDDWLWDS